jgi:hypothetical protein
VNIPQNMGPNENNTKNLQNQNLTWSLQVWNMGFCGGDQITSDLGLLHCSVIIVILDSFILIFLLFSLNEINASPLKPRNNLINS